jgi:hypothetical protein
MPRQNRYVSDRPADNGIDERDAVVTLKIQGDTETLCDRKRVSPLSFAVEIVTVVLCLNSRERIRDTPRAAEIKDQTAILVHC